MELSFFNTAISELTERHFDWRYATVDNIKERLSLVKEIEPDVLPELATLLKKANRREQIVSRGVLNLFMPMTYDKTYGLVESPPSDCIKITARTKVSEIFHDLDMPSEEILFERNTIAIRGLAPDGGMVTRVLHAGMHVL